MKILALILTIFTISLSANQPHNLNFQGILTDNLGALAADTTYTFGFSIYDAEVAGNKLWEETKALKTTNGIYQTTLGNESTLAILPFDKPYYVHITVNNTALPLRTKLVTVPYAISANNVTGTIAKSTLIADSLVVKDINGLKDNVSLHVEGSITMTVDPVTNSITLNGLAPAQGIVGPTGSQGPAGANGIAGTNGVAGETGPKGDIGETGHGLKIDGLCTASDRTVIINNSAIQQADLSICLDTSDGVMYMFRESPRQFLTLGAATINETTNQNWNDAFTHSQTDSLHFSNSILKTIAEQPVSTSLDGYLTAGDYTTFSNAAISIPTLFNQDTLFRATALDSISNVNTRLTSSISSLQSSTWQVNGNDSLHTSKKVGIGTNSPLTNLHIQKDILQYKHKDSFAGSIIEATEARLQLISTRTDNQASAIILSSAPDLAATSNSHWSMTHFGPGYKDRFAIGYTSTSSDNADITSTMSSYFTIDTLGRVGIGTNAPKSNLDIGGLMKLGTSALSCVDSLHGSLKFESNSIWSCQNSTWEELVPKSEFAILKSQIDSLSLVVKNINTPPTSYSSCKNILDQYPGSPSGTYIIDPDGLSSLSTISVYCDMSTDGGGWTRVAYTSDLPFIQHWTTDSTRWLDSDFSLELSNAHIDAIRSVSTEAKQTLNVRCLGVILYYYNTGADYRHATGFRFQNGEEFSRAPTPGDPIPPEYPTYNITVPTDGCKDNTSDSHTVFSINSIKLPITNIHTSDNGNSGEFFGSELTQNPVWFK